MTLTNKIKNNRGFSLVEFLIVVGILAVIAIIAIPITVGVINSSNKQNDEVLASTYSEYMQKFATEQVGSIGYYPTLKDDGVGSDYDILKNSSGKGSYPGITQLDSRINEMNEDEIWNLIRKEACIAISAYSGEELADPYNYFVEKPTDSSMAFVYYYLTGTVALESVEKMEDSKISVEQVNNGAIDTEDYWVYLDRKGGSGKAIGTGEATRDFYVKVVQFGTGLPLGGAKVTISPYGSSTGTTRSATTNETGMLVFRDVYDEIETSATKLGALDWWSEMHYSEFEHKINLATNPGKGTLANPFIITLKMGTLGSLEFYEQYKTYSYNPSGTSFVPRVEKIDWYNDFQTIFTVKEDSLTGIDETYNSSTPEHNPLELLGDQNKDGEFCFLIYGDYDMVIKNSTINNKTSAKNPYFADYHEEITSDVYGIYNTANPKEYPSMTSPYAYPVVLKRSDTLIKGQIMAENSEQSLHGTKTGLFASYDGSKNTKSVTIETYVYAVNTRDKSDYYVSNVLANPSTVNGNLVYDYELYLNGKYDGTQEYEIFLCTVYGTKDSSVISGKTVDKMTVAAWPTKISADGSIYELKTSTKEYVQINLESDVCTADSVSIKVYEKRGSFNRYLDCTATLTRKGYSTYTNGLTKYSGSVEENISNQYIQLSGVKQGFYNLTIDFDDTHTGDYPDIDGVPLPVIIDDNNEIIIELDPVNITYTITIEPVTSVANGSKPITPDYNLLDANASKGWDKISVGVTVGGVNLIEKGFTVTVDASTPTNNKATVTFNYGKTTKGLTITQSVKCFDSNDKLTVSNSIGKSSSKYESTLKIHRLEDESKSNEQHVGGANWKWLINTTQHYQECDRCKYDRLFSNHYQRKNVDGTFVYDQYSIFSTSSAKTANDTAVNTQHYKHCTVCNQYDETENCSGGAWTYVYNEYSNSTAHSNSHTGASGYALTKTGSSTSDTYHYKYCSTCHGRWSVATHRLGDAEEPGDCVTDGKNYCDDSCGYYIVIPGTGHTEKNDWFYTNTMSQCVLKTTTTTCAKCNITLKTAAKSTYIGHTHDVSSKHDIPYSSPCGGLFMRHQYHVENQKHKDWSRSCHSANYQTGAVLNPYDAEKYKDKSRPGEYYAENGETGYWISGAETTNYAGQTRYDGLCGKTIYYWWTYGNAEGWRCSSQRSYLSDGMVFYSGSDGKTKNQPISSTYTFSSLSEGCSGWSSYGTCKVGICCRQFQWPTDATSPSKDDNTFTYTSGGTKVGKWLYCFGQTSYERYGSPS